MPFGLVWQGARYEGLVTVFLEYLGAFGGAILDERGRVAVDSDAAVQALTVMRDAIDVDRRRAARRADLAGRADALRVPERPGGVHAQLAVRLCAAAGRVAVARRRPLRGGADAGGPGGAPTAALGGSAAGDQRATAISLTPRIG